MSEIRIDVPLIPPSAGVYNGYRVVQPRGRKPFVHCYNTEEAKAWWDAVAAAANGQQVRSRSYVVSFVVYTGDLRRQDLDNWGKCLLDGLTKAGVIDDDSHVTEIHGYKRLDRGNPRTVIVVRGDQETLF